MATQPPVKPWWRSKTLWFNVVLALAAAAEASFGLLQPLLPVNAYALLAYVLTVGNAALRVISASALALRQPPPAAAGDEPGGTT